MRAFAIGVAAAICLAAAGTQAAKPAPSSAQARLLAHGKYLVTRAVPCSDCHTPHNARGQLIEERALQGAPIEFTPIHPIPGWATAAPPIAGLPQGWSLEQTMLFLETGVTPGGGHAAPPMPQFRFNAWDAHAIAAYLQSLPKPASDNTHH